MDRDRDRTEDGATSVDEPTGHATGEDTPYDPAVTEGDEANIPEDSEAERDSG